MAKNWKVVALKDFSVDDKGYFKALFAPFNVVDHQGDLTLPGAFGEQKVIISGYGHASWREGVDSLPAGKGRIYDGETGGIVEGQFFLDTVAGSETYKTVKNLGDLQEWSYALPEIDYEVREQDGQHVRVLKKIKVNEVSPVLMGAGIGTQTLDVKSGIGKTITPSEGESESQFISRCIAQEVGSGIDQEQAAAICYRTWREGKSGKSIQLVDHLENVASDVKKAIDRLKDVAELREAQDRHPGSETMKRALKLRALLGDLSSELGRIAEKHDAVYADVRAFYEKQARLREVAYAQ